MYRSRSILATALLALLPAAMVAAQSVASEHVTARWLPGTGSVQPGVPFHLGLKLEHEPKWHTYWSNPGDFGYPTTVKWDLPEGMTADPIRYAVPSRLSAMGLTTFGYEGDTIHIVTLHPPDDLEPGTTVRIGGTVSWLECKEECIPGGGDLFIDVPVADSPGATHPDVEAARSAMPVAPGWPAAAQIEGDEMVITLTASTLPEPRPEINYFFPAMEGLADLSVPMKFGADGESYEIRFTLNPARAETPEQVDGLLVGSSSWIPGEDRSAVFISAPIGDGAASATAAPEAGAPPISFFYALLTAFLGGIILNLMPCVFPVISLKILSFVNLAGEDPGKVWRHGLLFAAGVVVSFWVVAGVLLAVRAAVPSAGWGFQLKEPIVVISMCVLFVLLALNLFGVFEIGTSLTTVGGSVQAGSSSLNTFLSGVLATVVATPCTGPFMGVAVGFALTQPAAVSFAVFTALGLGMAAPYLLLSRFPGWLRVIPKPGPWMESLKQFLGFLLLAFAMWLVWVLTGLRGTEGLGRLLAGLLLVGMAAWIYGRWGSLGRAVYTRVAAGTLAATLIFAGIVYAVQEPPETNWQPFSTELVEDLKASSDPFFIDFTADWCITCQANKRVALNTQTVQEAFAESGVTLIEADWTRQPQDITDALAAFGRSGVPLYLLYPGGGSEPIILPQILTPETVLNELEKLN